MLHLHEKNERANANNHQHENIILQDDFLLHIVNHIILRNMVKLNNIY